MWCEHGEYITNVGAEIQSEDVHNEEVTGLCAFWNYGGQIMTVDRGEAELLTGEAIVGE